MNQLQEELRSVRSWSITVAVVGLLGLFGLVSNATGQSLAPTVPRAPGVPEGRRLVETVKIWKMTEALNLDENQAAKLFPKLAQLESSRRQFQRQQRVLRDELSELLKQQPLRDQEVKAKLEQLERAEIDFREREQGIKGGLRTILSVEQQARLALFEDRFETEMRRAIQDLRQRHRRLPPAQSQSVESPGLRDQPTTPVESELPPR
jgi:Spy/CpxP family protein refolding chaperone